MYSLLKSGKGRKRSLATVPPRIQILYTLTLLLMGKNVKGKSQGQTLHIG